VAVVTLLERRENVLRVQGLDALNGSPVLDIKPYLPPYDSILSSHLPAWAVGAELD
jgi:tRNA (Thr-GGU) A37 N-methylase